MFDFSSLPVPGSLIVGCMLYAGASVVAGQVVGARTIAKSGWVEVCETSIEASVADERARRQREDALVQETDCESVVGRWHPDLNRLCWEFGNPDLVPGAGAAREAEREARALEDRQLAQAAAGAGSQCACAAGVYRRTHLIVLALYAGSARAVSMPPISNMETGLQQALHEPLCTIYTGGGA